MSILKKIYSLKSGNLVFSIGRLLQRQNLYRVLCENPIGVCLMLHESGMSSIWRDVKFTLYLYFSFCFILFKQLLYHAICCQAFSYWDPKRTLYHLFRPSPQWRTSCLLDFKIFLFTYQHGRYWKSDLITCRDISF